MTVSRRGTRLARISAGRQEPANQYLDHLGGSAYSSSRRSRTPILTRTTCVWGGARANGRHAPSTS